MKRIMMQFFKKWLRKIFCRIQKRFPAALRGGNVRAMGRILTAMGIPRMHTREGSMYQVVPL